MEAARCKHSQSQKCFWKFQEVLFFLGESYRHLVFLIANFRNAATCQLKFTDLPAHTSVVETSGFGSQSQKQMVVLMLVQYNKLGYQVISCVYYTKKLSLLVSWGGQGF